MLEQERNVGTQEEFALILGMDSVRALVRNG